MKRIYGNNICTTEYTEDECNFIDNLELKVRRNVLRGFIGIYEDLGYKSPNTPEYYYCASGNNVPDVKFESHEDAWSFMESHAGYDCVVEFIK